MKTVDELIKKLTEAKEELTKNTNASYSGAPNSSSMSMDSMAMSEECHPDDPNHEKKEQAKAKKIKSEAEKLLDMHKACGSMEKMSVDKNGQWKIEKADKKEFSSYKEVGDAIDSAFSEADFNPATKHPKDPTAGMPAGKKPGERTTATGFKLKVAKEDVEKKSTDQDIAEVYQEEIKNPANRANTGTKTPGMSGGSKPWASGGRGSTKAQIAAEAKQAKAKPAPVTKPKL